MNFLAAHQSVSICLYTQFSQDDFPNTSHNTAPILADICLSKLFWLLIGETIASHTCTIPICIYHDVFRIRYLMVIKSGQFWWRQCWRQQRAVPGPIISGQPDLNGPVCSTCGHLSGIYVTQCQRLCTNMGRRINLPMPNAAYMRQ